MASRGAEYDRTRGTGDAEDTTPEDTASGHPSATDTPSTNTAPADAAGTSEPGEANTVDPKVAAAIAAAEAAGPPSGGTVRVDSWIWSVRLVKTRSMGATACRGGHVRVNGERVKPAHAVRVGDEVRLRHENRERIVVVTRLIRKRVGAPVAVQCYIDNSPPPPPREAVAPAGIRDRGAGRPTKRDRREMERLRGLAGPGPALAAASAAARASRGPERRYQSTPRRPGRAPRLARTPPEPNTTR
ncbi:RNA-binding S4 domain-containing protein [Streptomyces tuirus]|uniref:RNA-binding S4 domain-containing protein n=1 Tax=Streptomyces tuirus TaxID=68278 RepID=A0A941J258_9ACTN|nr:RNA-binding S4 domain-containing protein [Streptomyces tuirus]